jgi:multicomponent Na+:H+ antiporter subunit C
MIELFLDRYVYIFVLALLCIGLYGMLAKGDLVKKVIGMVIFQTAIYIFFIQGSLQEDGTAPIIDPAFGPDPDRYVDPLPHLLILTAIVVGVGVLGVALALLIRIYRAHGSFDEAVVAARLAGAPEPASDVGGDRGDVSSGQSAYGPASDDDAAEDGPSDTPPDDPSSEA